MPLELKIDRLGWILLFLGILFLIIIPLPYQLPTLTHSAYSALPNWIWTTQTIGFLFLLVFIIYQIRKQDELKKQLKVSNEKLGDQEQQLKPES